MPTTLIIILAILFVVAFSFSFLYSKFYIAKAYTKEDLENRIKNTSEQEIREFYTSEMGDYIKHLNGKKPIAASCLFHIPDTKRVLEGWSKKTIYVAYLHWVW